MKARTVYRLTVGPDMASIRKGYFMRQTFPDYDSADTLFKRFTALGAVCYLEKIETKTVGVRVDDDDLKAYWGGME